MTERDPAQPEENAAVHRLQEERDDLLRAIAHDLRTPLNAIYMQALLLERGGGGVDGVAERGRQIVKSCERLSEMLQDLAESALLEDGRRPLEPQAIALSGFIDELFARLQGGLDVGRVRLTLPPELPRVLADPRRLERILVKLLSNALEHSPAQTEIEVRAVAVDAGVELSVIDHGVGIAPADQVHLFERWFRSKGTPRPERRGLGLYITRMLVEAQGGRIGLESTPGQGSRFRVTLPAVPSAR